MSRHFRRNCPPVDLFRRCFEILLSLVACLQCATSIRFCIRLTQDSMGCSLIKLLRGNGSERLNETENEDPPKVYSWEKRATINVKDFIVDGIKNETVGRMPGSVDGQQFIIQNCEDCNIYIFDHCAAVTVDDCTNCRILIGAIKSSIFIRDCTNCVVVTTCQQFRTRDCKRLDILLYCVTKPIIESTTGTKFGCFRFNYPQLKDHMRAAGLGVFNNNWNSIHDFTPVPGEKNYSFIPQSDPITKYLPLPTEGPYTSLAMSTEAGDSVVPYTLGSNFRPVGCTCVIAISHCTQQTSITETVIKELNSLNLVQAAELKLSMMQAKSIFPDGFANKVNMLNTLFIQVHTGTYRYIQVHTGT